MSSTPKILQAFLFLFILPQALSGQDSTIIIDKKVVTLREVVIRNNLNVASFIEKVQADSSFRKAFKNLRITGYSALNDIRMMNKGGEVAASLQRRTRQTVENGCRSMQVLEEQTTGDIYDKDRNWNYYTAELYASLLFVKDTVCGENNIVKDEELSLKNKTGVAKHKEQLRMLFFNPGKRIPGIPFIGDKIAIFSEEMAPLYDFEIDMTDYQGQDCYLFTIKARKDLSSREKDRIVINKMVTWFNAETMEITARNYDLSYNAGIYDFDVSMEVQLSKVKDLLVPVVLRYTGNWYALFKQREKGIFTATLFDFTF